MEYEVLISEVLSRKAIWQSSHPYHHNRRVLDNMWDEIAKKIGCSRKRARQKWKYLKDQYRRELHKIRDYLEEDGTIFTPTWPFFRLLTFLNDEMSVQKQHRANNQSSYHSSQSSVSPHQTKRSEGGSEKSDEEKDEIDVKSFSLLSTPEERSEASESFEVNSGKSISHGRKRPHPDVNDVRSLQKLNVTSKECYSDLENSDDYHFFMSLLPSMRNFNNTQKLRIRSKMQQAILEEMTAVCESAPAMLSSELNEVVLGP